MIKKFCNFGRKDSMIRDSFSLFSATMIANLGAFIFHLIMGRSLGVAGYSVLGVLLSLVHILGVPVNVLQTVVTRFVSQFNTSNEKGKINSLLRRSFGKLFLYSLVLFGLALLISPFLASFLKISTKSVILLSPVIVFVALLPIMRGAFQGLQRFHMLSLNLFVEVIVKLGVGILLIFIGFGVNGAIIAVTLSFLFPTIIAMLILKKYFIKTGENIDTRQIYKYSHPVLFAILFLTVIFSVDIFLVKHFFDEASAAFYAAASLIGKVIFFACLPISQVLFPKSIENQTLNRPTSGILKKGVFLILLISIPIVAFYFLFPKFVINVLFGNEFVSVFDTFGNNIVFFFGFAMMIFSLNYLFANYNLSINKTNFVYPIIFISILEIVLIYIFHSSLLQVVLILNSVLLLLFFYLLIYTIRNLKWSSYQ